MPFQGVFVQKSPFFDRLNSLQVTLTTQYIEGKLKSILHILSYGV